VKGRNVSGMWLKEEPWLVPKKSKLMSACNLQSEKWFDTGLDD
jgi:hypothetical protein